MDREELTRQGLMNRLAHSVRFRSGVVFRRGRRVLRRNFGRDACEAYHFWYYETDVQARITFEGISIRKSVLDLWNYQQIIWALKPSVVVEFGTKHGGSALWFARLLDAMGSGRVITVDTRPERVDERTVSHPRIEVRGGMSTDPALIAELSSLRSADPEPWFLILDSDHTRDNVYAELAAVTPFLRSGDRVIVEDGNINGNPVAPAWGPGPLEAIRDYFRDFPGAYTSDLESERRFGWTFAPSGYLIRN